MEPCREILSGMRITKEFMRGIAIIYTKFITISLVEICAETKPIFGKEVIEYRVSAGHHGVYMAGGKIIYNKTRPDYDRVTYFEVGGEPWDPDRIYRVVTSDFLATGNAGLYMLPLVPEVSRKADAVARISSSRRTRTCQSR